MNFRFLLCVFLHLGWGGPAVAQSLVVSDDNWDAVDILFPESTESVIFGGDPRWEELSQWSKDSSTYKTSQAVGRLKIRKSGGISLCTAFLIGPGKLMTNYHCIPGDGTAKEAVLEMGFYRQLGRVVRYAVSVSPEISDSGKDFSVLSVAGSPEADWGHLNLAMGDVVAGTDLFVVHHPMGLPKKISRVGCFSGPDANLPNNHFLHQCDTVGGSSGAPILDQSGSVVGIHHRGTLDRGVDAYNRGTRMVSIRPDVEIFTAKLEIDATILEPGPTAPIQEVIPKKAEIIPPIQDIQKELSRLGCYPGTIDGIWGPQSKAALKSFVVADGMSTQRFSDLEPDNELYAILQQQSMAICVTYCEEDLYLRNGECILKPCPVGQKRNSTDQCYSSEPKPRNIAKNCIEFDGRLICE